MNQPRVPYKQEETLGLSHWGILEGRAQARRHWFAWNEAGVGTYHELPIIGIPAEIDQGYYISTSESSWLSVTIAICLPYSHCHWFVKSNHMIFSKLLIGSWTENHNESSDPNMFNYMGQPYMKLSDEMCMTNNIYIKKGFRNPSSMQSHILSVISPPIAPHTTLWICNLKDGPSTLHGLLGSNNGSLNSAYPWNMIWRVTYFTAGKTCPC